MTLFRWPIMLAAVTAVVIPPLCAQEVEGRVVDDGSGDGFPSVELKLRTPGASELAADLETDRDGRFRASGLAAGEYTVEVSKPNFITTNLKLRLPAVALQLRLVRYAVISGQVVETQGQPLPGRVLTPYGRQTGGTRIAVLVKPPGSEEFESVRQVLLGDGGKYRIFDLPPGQYAVGLWWSGLPMGSGAQMYPDNAHPRMFTISGGEDYRDINFTVVAGPSFSVSGKIEGPRPKMEFNVALGLPDLPTLPIAYVWSEDDGRYTLEKIPPGTYDLYVAGPANGYGFNGTSLGKDPVYGRTRIQVIGQNLENLSVPVSPGKSVELMLRGPGDSPPKGCPPSATVFLTLLEPWWLGSDLSVQAVFGKAQTVKDAPPARYRVGVSGLGTSCYQVTRPVVDLSRESSGPVAVVVDQAGAIHGTLRAGSAKPKNFAVLLLDSDAAPGIPAQLAFPDEQGRFAFEGLRPGRYRITAQPAAAKARWVADVTKMVEIDVPGGAPTDLDLPVSAPKGGGQ